MTTSSTRSTILVARSFDAQFLRDARALYDYLRRDMSDSDEQRKALYPVNWRLHVPRYLPGIYAFARETATSYLQRPSRSWKRPDGTALPDATVAMLEDAYSRLRVNSVMLQHDRELAVLNNATIWVQPNFRTGLAELVCTPIHDQDVEMSTPYAREEDDAAVWRYLVPIPVKGAMQPSTLPAVAYVTTKEAYWESAPSTIEGKGIWVEEPTEDGKYPNPFGTIPVVLSRGTPPAPGRWWSPLNLDLLAMQRALNHDATDIGFIARMQGFGQPYTKGLSGGSEKEIRLGPENVIGLPQDGDFGFASANPKLADYQAAVSEYLAQTVAMNGLNPATFLKSSGITALAKQVELMDREVYRRERVEILQRAEQRLYDVLRAVVNWQRGADVWPEAVVSLEYRQPIMPADPLHHVQALERNVAMGQQGRVRARSILDGVTMDEALRRIEEDRDYDTRAGFGAVNVELADGTADVPDTTASAAPPALDVAPGSDVQRQALNGAQVAELAALIAQVATRQMPAQSARAIILAAYPLDAASVDAMIAPLAAFVPSQTQPAPEGLA